MISRLFRGSFSLKNPLFRSYFATLRRPSLNPTDMLVHSS